MLLHTHRFLFMDMTEAIDIMSEYFFYFLFRSGTLLADINNRTL